MEVGSAARETAAGGEKWQLGKDNSGSTNSDLYHWRGIEGRP